MVGNTFRNNEIDLDDDDEKKTASSHLNERIFFIMMMIISFLLWIFYIRYFVLFCFNSWILEFFFVSPHCKFRKVRWYFSFSRLDLILNKTKFWSFFFFTDFLTDNFWKKLDKNLVKICEWPVNCLV